MMRTFDGYSVNIVFVTPELAREWLATSKGNRPLQRKYVMKYIDCLKSGDWGMVPDCIAFDADGHLTNGHHRLTAVMESGIGASFPVMNGLRPRDEDKTDGGRVRTACHQLWFKSPEMKYKKLSLAICRTLIGVENETASKSFETAKKETFSDGVVEYLFSHEEEIKSAIHEVPDTVNYCGNRSAHVAAFILLKRNFLINANEIKDFYDKVESGADLPKDSPVLALRNAMGSLYFTGNKRKLRNKGKLDYYQICLTVKAFRQYLAGQKVSILRIGNMGFRELVDGKL